MKRKFLAIGCVWFLLSGLTPANAESETRDISKRIQALRERLEQLRGVKLKAQEETSPQTSGSASKSPDDVEAHSDALEHRQDVKVMILFHEGVDKGDDTGLQPAAQSQTQIQTQTQTQAQTQEQTQAQTQEQTQEQKQTQTQTQAQTQT